MNREATVDKAVDLIRHAAEKGAKIIQFPETFIPCYPRGLSFGTKIGRRTEAGRKDYGRFSENAVTVPSQTTTILGEAARKAGAYLIIGVVERAFETSASTLYNIPLVQEKRCASFKKHRRFQTQRHRAAYADTENIKG
jgi:nitrilase